LEAVNTADTKQHTKLCLCLNVWALLVLKTMLIALDATRSLRWSPKPVWCECIISRCCWQVLRASAHRQALVCEIHALVTDSLIHIRGLSTCVLIINVYK